MKKIMLLALVSFFTISSFAQATPCGFQYGKTEKDSLKCLEEISLFRNYYDQKNFRDAHTHWRNIVELCPCSWSAIFNTTYLQSMFDFLIKGSEDEEVASQYVDELLNAFATRHLFFPRNYTEGNGLGFKAFYMIRYRGKNTESVMQAFDLFIESIEMEKEKTQPNIWDIYFRIAEQIARGKKDTTIMIDAYERATDYIEMAILDYYKQIEKHIPNFENLEEALAAGQITQADYENRINRLSQDTARAMQFINNYERTLKNIEIAFTPFAPCHVLEQVYANKLEQNKENLPALKKMLIIMNKGQCTEFPIFAEILNIVHQAEPGAQTANLMGYYSLNHGDYEAALNFFKEAISLFETNEQKADPWYMIGLIHQIRGNFSEARSAALEVIRIKPNSGRAYMLIGDLYAASGSRCSGEDAIPFEYNWAADDKFRRAATVDPSVADQARERRAKLRFPTVQERFSRGFTTEGIEYRVGCWINEVTIIR